ncbi:Pycsar system effector family protein [Thiocystis violacea]|uniref:Pycsar system effector family protein n=1 Tax=Thiocystis violacea TaxID=13725 RepID=UPI0034E28532
MRALLKDQEDVYATMSGQLYWLGQMANRKFELLKVTYIRAPQESLRASAVMAMSSMISTCTDLSIMYM